MATDINDAAQNAKGGEIDRLAAELAELTGEDPADAVLAALRERLERVSRQEGRSLHDDVEDIVQRLKAAPVYDDRSPDEIVGYDEHGGPC